MLKLTVLGNNGPYPAQGGACSGYLLQGDRATIVLDLGSGSLANLISALSAELESIDAIILSHLHADHISDISVLRYAVFRPNGATDRDGAAKKIPLYCPAAPEQEYATLCSYGQFDVHPISEELTLDIRGLLVSFAPMTHPYPVYAVSVRESAAAARKDATDGDAAAARKFVYSGDTTWNQDIILFAEDADLLLIDACFISQDRLSGHPPVHLTAEECGIIAGEAGVGKMLLTHFPPGGNVAQRVAEARAGVQKVLGRNDAVAVEASKILTSYEV
jgi:ribonuclease BN (tRNA processing enzyme)